MKKQLILLAAFLLSFDLFATHIKGGQIRYKKISHLTVEFTVIGYRDINGVPFGQGVFDFGNGELYGDDQNEIIPWGTIEDLGNGIERWTFKLVHTYGAASHTVVSYSEDFRSLGTVNISGSVSTPFYLNASVSLDPLLDTNSSPSLNHIPSFSALLGEKYTASFAHEDAEGDSLSYKLIIPQQAEGLAVNGYLFPNDPVFSDDSMAFSLDPRTGDLIWDNPALFGSYAIAIKTEEWRDVNGEFQLIGYSTLDFVLTVLEGQFPVITLESPEFSCIRPGQDFQDSIIVNNPSNVDLKFQIETKVQSLLVNGIKVADWNEQWSDSTFAGESIRFSLQVSGEEMANYDGFNNAIFSASRYQDSEILVNYSTNSLVGVGCPTEGVVNSVSDEIADIFIQKDELRVNFKAGEPYEVSIYSVSGALLKGVSVKNSPEIKIDYPFSNNTVYVILVRSTTRVTTQKVLFSKD